MRLAKKVFKYVVEPKNDGFSEKWESFHATNPSSVRVSGSDKVFLAYRAGGSADRYFLFDKFCYGSSMGLCILDSRGEEVVYRFPLPIIRMDRGGIVFPQTLEEMKKYEIEHKSDIVVLHDFRFFTLRGYIYVLMHEGSIFNCYDTIVRMPEKKFLMLIDKSTKLIDSGKVSEEKWDKIWKGGEVFEPCGYKGTNRVWSSTVNKNDIVMLELGNGKVQINHRSLPDYAALETDGECFSSPTADGFTRLGVLENCTRAGYYDNSHVGNNGNPIKMKVRGEDVYMDIVHGVNNLSITNKTKEGWNLMYVPYLRLKSAYNGEVLFYSDDPVLIADDIWKEYVEDGAWVSKLSHLRGVMFPGGQVAKDINKITENDDCTFYTGVGDTAVARADFSLSELMTELELCDIGNYTKNCESRTFLNYPKNEIKLKQVIEGWDFSLVNHNGQMCVKRVRNDGICIGETAFRPITKNAGDFDFGGCVCDGKTVYDTKYGFVVPIKGYNFRYGDNDVKTTVGYGVVILSKEHPEKVIYKSKQSIIETVEYLGNDIGTEFVNFSESQLLSSINKKILEEIEVSYEMIEDGKTFASDHAKWLKERGKVLTLFK